MIKEKGDVIYLKLLDDGRERRVFPALLVQQSHVVVKLTDVRGVHLQVRPLLDKDVRQRLVLAPEIKASKTFSASEKTVQGWFFLLVKFRNIR